MIEQLTGWLGENRVISRSRLLAKLGLVTVGAIAGQMVKTQEVLAYCGSSQVYGCSGCGMCCNCGAYSDSNGACCWYIQIGCRAYECCDYDEGYGCPCQCRFFLGYAC